MTALDFARAILQCDTRKDERREGNLPDAADRFVLDRRVLLAGAIALVGGTLAGFPAELLALAPATQARFFTPAQFAILDAVVDIIIPRTDTPGARDAGVADFIDRMMSRWASPDHKLEYAALIDDIDRQAGGLIALAGPARIEAVRAYDAAAFAAHNEAYRKFKELVLTAYYWSEPGATQELRYELAPGIWEPRVPMTPATRAWAV
jgi:gluconate 2-dehydrogenase gamma chain